MRRKTSNKLYFMTAFTLFLMIFAFAFAPAQTMAKGLGKPKMVRKSCSYRNGKVCLKWKKVKGAKKYQIYRSKVNPKTGKHGKWKKWAVTKKVSFMKKASGDFYYRVQAIKGKKKGKYSGIIRIFTASGSITHIGYTEPDVFFGVTLSEGMLELRVLVANKTKSPMGFLPSGTRVDEQSKIYAIDKKTKKPVKIWEADLDTTGIAKQVNPGKKQSLYFYAYVTAEEWAKYKNCKLMIVSSFYPNPEVEPMKNQMALTSTQNAKESAIAGK